MPRVVLRADSPPRPYESLVQQLAEELILPGNQPQPLIVEKHIRGTMSRHVWVIWDRWSELDEEERTAAIIEAYEKFEGVESADNITIALGIRPQKAILFGIVPCIVQPIHPHLIERTDYRQARAQEARNTVLGEQAKELRYPSEQEAKPAIDRLKQISPQTSWVIHQDEEAED